MLVLDQIPAFQAKDLVWGTCGLSIVALEPVSTLDEAWQMLPSQGEGVVVRADSVKRYSTGDCTGLLLDAEVAQGDKTTVIRACGERWNGWRWQETTGETHRFVEYTFLSSEPGQKTQHQVYRQYWHQCEDSGVQVWEPVGARFCGFREGK